jgi:transcriptional regulator with GAF, ATPase, and Fis domain
MNRLALRAADGPPSARREYFPVAGEKVRQMDSELLSDTFVELADTMVADFDVIDFLHLLTSRSVALLEVSAAGVMLVDPRGELRVAAASTEAAGLIELFQIQNDQGPCLECFRTGRPITVADLTGPGQRWPRFAAAATQAGFRAVEALPMRLRDQVIGALNLFGAEPGTLSPAALRIGQALADVATIGLLQERNVRRNETVAEQLQAALNSRVVIEQAKGKLAERLGLDMDRAFALLRDYARNSNQRLTDVARRFVDSASADFPPPPREHPHRTPNVQRPHRAGPSG